MILLLEELLLRVIIYYEVYKSSFLGEVTIIEIKDVTQVSIIMSGKVL